MFKASSIKRTTAIMFAAGAIAMVGATNAQAAGSIEGCPSGAACVYPGADWNGGHPSLIFYSYGGHNLYNQNGVHRIFNNQTGGATMQTCLGSNGTSCEGYMLPTWYLDKDLTPINSIRLNP